MEADEDLLKEMMGKAMLEAHGRMWRDAAGAGTSSTAKASITLGDLKKWKWLACPFAQILLGNGASPDTHFLVVPQALKEEGKEYPEYVKFSVLADDHVYVVENMINRYLGTGQP